MWDPTTGRVHQSRDIIWLQRMYFQRQHGPAHIIVLADGQHDVVAAASTSGEAVDGQTDDLLADTIPTIVTKGTPEDDPNNDDDEQTSDDNNINNTSYC